MGNYKFEGFIPDNVASRVFQEPIMNSRLLPLDRRVFLAFASWYLIFPTSACVSNPLPKTYVSDISRHFGLQRKELESIVSVGTRILATRSDALECSEIFLKEFREYFRNEFSYKNPNSQAILKWLQQCIDADLRNNQFFWIDGWLVSKTEASFSVSLARMNLKI